MFFRGTCGDRAQIARELTNRGVASLRIGRERAVEHRLKTLWPFGVRSHVVQRARGRCQPPNQRLARSDFRIWEIGRQQMKEDETERVDIRADVEALAGKLLG